MKTKKWLLTIVVCAALCVWFAGCDTAASSSTSRDVSAEVASYSNTDDSTTITFSYYNDGTFTCASHSGSVPMVTIKGTYTGNPAIDGNIVEVITHTLSEESKTLVTVQTYCEEKEITYDISNWTVNISVSGGSFTVGSTTFTRD